MILMDWRMAIDLDWPMAQWWVTSTDWLTEPELGQRMALELGSLTRLEMELALV